jgi:NAD(P)-dependent dehydrogenase (short-subunit alcohol dehydrogenase family)
VGVNLMGVVHGIRSFLPIMIEQDSEAHIVNTASLGGLIASGALCSDEIAVVGPLRIYALQREGPAEYLSCASTGRYQHRVFDRNRPAELPTPQRRRLIRIKCIREASRPN